MLLKKKKEFFLAKHILKIEEIEKFLSNLSYILYPKIVFYQNSHEPQITSTLAHLSEVI